MESTARNTESFRKAYAGLNDGQRKAVDQVEGPVLVIAGPGTGKTQILAVRIGKILMDTDAMPENILCLTYTDAGTVAMRKRLLEFIGTDAHRVHIHTFHAFCNDVIQQHLDYFGKRELEPITDLENVMLIEDLLSSLPPGHPHRKLKGDLSFEVVRMNNLFRLMKEEDWDEMRISAAIDIYLADLPNREEYIYKRANAKAGIRVGDPKTAKIREETERMEKLRSAAALFPEYNRRMRAMGRYDYSDMILWVVKAFRDTSPEGENMLRAYQERFLYILVDEFQDTNGAQNEILQSLISYWEVPNVFAVGDDDQSIYEFQGARVQNILDFYQAYAKHMEVVVLTDNYRSHQSILDASKVVITQNQDRLINKLQGLSKDLRAAHPGRQHVTEPRVTEYITEAQEHAGILEDIETLLAGGVKPEDIAILYYKHSQADTLISAVQRRGIPFQVKKKTNVLEVPVVQQMLNILNYLEEEAQRPHSAEHRLFEIMHYPYFDIHVHDIAALSAWIASRRDDTITWRTVLSDPDMLRGIRLRSHEALLQFEKKLSHWLQETFNLTLQMLFEKVLNESGLLQYILKQSDRTFMLEAIHTLFGHIQASALTHPRLTVKDYMEVLDQMELHQLPLQIQRSGTKQGGIQFITTHSSKGLEFEYVFLMGCTSNNWDASRGGNSKFSMPDTLTLSNEENRLESMRRLFYVAMTRAKQHLYISYAAHNNDGKELQASQFVAELLEGTDLVVQQRTVDAAVMESYQITALLTPPPVEVELFDKEYIASRLENFTLSASKLNAYLHCPVAFYFNHIVKVPSAKSDTLAFGNAIHVALHKLYTRMKEDPRGAWPAQEVFIGDFIREMQRTEDAFTEKQFVNRVELGKQLLTDFYETRVPHLNKIAVTEYLVGKAVVDGVPITGRLDKLEFHGKQAHVVDYKTGGVSSGRKKLDPPSEKEPDGGEYWRQIIFYKILLDSQKQKDWVMVSGEMLFLERDDKDEPFSRRFEVTPEEIGVVKAQIKDTYKRITQLEFSPGCGNEDCDWCNFIKTYSAIT